MEERKSGPKVDLRSLYTPVMILSAHDFVGVGVDVGVRGVSLGNGVVVDGNKGHHFVN